jgi:hypothetical protein
MSDLVNALGNALPDLAILALSAITFALIGTVIAFLSNRLWFRHWPQHSAFEDKLADTAHTSLLGLSAFVLALLITNDVSSLAKTQENVGEEAVNIHRLSRELEALGPSARDAKEALVAYTRNVAQDEWKRLANPPNALSPAAQRNLDDLWTGVHAAQRAIDPSNASRADLARYAARIETLREARLAAATSNIPNIFWVILLLFVAAASFFAGREAPKRFGVQVNMIHMAAIGLAVGLVIILNNPFRGETSIDPAIIGDAPRP